MLPRPAPPLWALCLLGFPKSCPRSLSLTLLVATWLRTLEARALGPPSFLSLWYLVPMTGHRGPSLTPRGAGLASSWRGMRQCGLLARPILQEESQAQQPEPSPGSSGTGRLHRVSQGTAWAGGSRQPPPTSGGVPLLSQAQTARLGVQGDSGGLLAQGGGVCKGDPDPLDTHQSEEDEEDEEMVEAKVRHDSDLESPDEKQEVKEAPPRELTEEEKQQILHSEEFLIFFDRTIRVIERALAEDSDIFFDYSGRELEDKDGDVQAGANLSFNRQFYDEHWSKHRVVTCMDWSLQYPELMVASYNSNEDAPHEPDGVALVWNMKFKKTTPEYVFHCQSSVMSVCLARFHPNLVVGGTYSGQIVLWDNRSHRGTPVQRTPLSAAAHTHPVYCVNVVGTQNAHNLITVSTDGKLCSWSLDMLSTPQESMELVYNKSKPVAVTGMAFPTGDVNNFVVGSEEGTVYTACRHGSKAGIGEVFEGHQGPVTGINCHMAVGPIDFSHLFVTSSFDWTVKLWSTKVPTASVAVEGASALNRVRWAHTGKEVAVGDSEGRIWIYDVGELAVPHNDEWTRFARTLVEIRAKPGSEGGRGGRVRPRGPRPPRPPVSLLPPPRQSLSALAACVPRSEPRPSGTPRFFRIGRNPWGRSWGRNALCLGCSFIYGVMLGPELRGTGLF
uniref:Dynein cytoplasmic 1 intermediate chain 1 n=1 Tax=Sarcophilus harrisii TaxID=9305 RepID=A0A7N4P466_SARHA